MNVEPTGLQLPSKSYSPVLLHDGGMVSHVRQLSTFCTSSKHILSLDAILPRPQRRCMHVGERIKIARTSRGFSQGQLADEIGASQTAVSSWERGRTEPTREMVVRIADVLRIPPSDIESPEQVERVARRITEVPVLSWVSAGRLTEPSDVSALGNSNHEKLPVADLPGGEYFATVVRGDSMDRISPEGSRIIVDAGDRDPRPGRCYLFSLRGETTYKRFQSEPVIRLEPFSTNPANQIIFPKSDRDWLVIGRVVRSYIDLV